MLDEGRILAVLDCRLPADPVYIWLRVSQQEDLSIKFVPRETLLWMLGSLVDCGYICKLPHDSFDAQFQLTPEGARARLRMLSATSESSEVQSADELPMAA